MFKVRKPLYGLCDSGDYWPETVHRYFKHDLGLIPMTGDQSLFSSKVSDGVASQGLLSLYVDDLLGAGNDAFLVIVDTLSDRFDVK